MFQKDPCYPPGYKAPGQMVCQGQPAVYNMGQPTYVIVAPNPGLENPPPTHLTLAIFVTLCCCWPIGIFAILRASSCKNAIGRADQHEAVRLSREAKMLSLWALGVGIAFNMMSLALFVTVYALFIIPSWSM